MSGEMTVTVGVDTHTDAHVAAVLDPAGRLLETQSFPATTRGYARLATWAESFGEVDKVGMKGTGSFGAGLETPVGPFSSSPSGPLYGIGP